MKDVRRENMRKNIMNKRCIVNKRWLQLIMLVFGIFLLTGCVSAEEENVEITFIHGFGTAEDTHVAMRQIYKDFEKEHPEIHVNMISMPSSEDVLEKVGDLLTVGEIPDIIFTAGEGKETIYKYMVEQDYAVDLMPYMKKDKAFYNSVSPVILNSWLTNQGELYTVSDVLFMIGYWYNCDLFAMAGISEPPKTWDEMEEACRRLKITGQKIGKQITPMILDTEHITYLTNAILHEENISKTEEIDESFIDVQSEEFQAAIKQLRGLAEYTDVLNAYSFRDSLDAFNKEKTAIYMNGVWGTYLIDQNLNVAYAPFPSWNGESVSMISSCVGYLLGNTRNQKKIDASVEFLKYMLSEPVAQRILEETGQVPSNPNVEIREDIANGRLYQAVSSVKTAKRVIEVPANIWSREIQKAYGENMILYMEDKISVEDIQKNLNELF